MTTSRVARVPSPLHHRARSVDRDGGGPWVTRASGSRRTRFARVLLAGLCLLAGCTAEPVTEPLTASPSTSIRSPGSAPTAVEDPSIKIRTPPVGGEIGSPVSITGTADVVRGALTVRVLGEDHNELAAILVRASCGDGCRGRFGTQLYFFVERKQPGTIQVYGTGGDGERALASVPVVLFPS